MKKKLAKSKLATSDAGQPDYVVGLVSNSLSANQTTPGTSALASLFSVASTPSKLVYVPAPKLEPKASQKEETKRAPSKDETVVKEKKLKKEKSLAKKRLDDRESALQNADDEDIKCPKNFKRKAPERNEDEEQPGKRQKLAWNKAEERIKLKRTVFVGNLPVNCKKKDLKKIFRDLGAIESVRFRSILREDQTMSRKLATIRRQADTKKPSINAYVVFKDEEGATNALQRNGMEIQKDFYIRVDRASQHGTHDHKRSIFVGNLPYDILELPLRQHFEECGIVEAVRLIRDRNTGLGKGFGYILFENTDAVMLALKLNGSQLLDRKIRVKRSVKKEKEKKGEGPAGRGLKCKSRGDAVRKKGPKPGTFKGFKSAEGNKAAKRHKSGANLKPSTSFKGKMSDAHPRKSKGLKKKFKPKKNKTIHI